MKTATAITITLGRESHTHAVAEDFVPMLRQAEVMVGTSREAYLAAGCRLGSMLWQLRAVAPYGTWKRLLAMANIDEHRAQRCMRVAVKLAPAGEIDRTLVASLREAARANGATMAYVQSDDTLASWNQAEGLIAAATRTQPRHKATSLSGSGESPGAAFDGVHGVPTTTATMEPPIEGDEAVADALGMTVEELRLLAEPDQADPCESEPAPVSLGPSGPSRGAHGVHGAAGAQLSLADLYEHRRRVAQHVDVALARALARAESGSVDAASVSQAMEDIERAIDQRLARLGVS